MNPEQIPAELRSRLAYVYVRQSSPHQVMNHRESQIRQRGLETRAQDLGWQNDRVIIVEDDTGTSASRSSPRSAFEAMVADAALGNVGLIVSLEVSRLSRGNRNWYHLLDICAVTRTLIADADGLYDPRSYNDRLLLGLKGTMSEAELHIMKGRLVEAVRSKAKQARRVPLSPAARLCLGRSRSHAEDPGRTGGLSHRLDLRTVRPAWMRSPGAVFSG